MRGDGQRVGNTILYSSIYPSVCPDESHKLQLSTEEYLHSLVSLTNELSRLAVNSVTLGKAKRCKCSEGVSFLHTQPELFLTGDFGTPLRLSTFIKDLHAGFQMLNLKNDSLRKRFDSIKVSLSAEKSKG